MAQANIAAFGSIVSYSSQDSAYPWINLLDGNTATNGRSAIGNPRYQWVIIDLGTVWPLTGFKLWGGSLSDVTSDVFGFDIAISATGITDSDFIKISPYSHLMPPRKITGAVQSSQIAIAPSNVRYVKLYLYSNRLNALYINASDLEIYSLTIDQITTSISSAATIYLPQQTETIASNAFIFYPVFTDQRSILANAEITDTKSDQLSDALIVDGLIYSNSVIKSIESNTIISNAYVYRSGSYKTNLLLFGTANPVSQTHNMLVFSTDISSSKEVIVDDMITGPIMDMNTISPPLGYNNYDWKYDWVVRTFNQCQYKFEVRSADELLELSAEPFHAIQLEDQIYKGQVNRYHQWRCHIWASGSGDFELHQFTIKGYVDYPANPLYRTLYEKPFITTSHVKAPGDTFTQQLYEPPLEAMSWAGPYIPGDLNGDFNLTTMDATILIQTVFGILSKDLIPAPGFYIRGIYSDFAGHIVPNVGDAVQINQYILSAGPPPKKRQEPI
jgi:hypothetical protein